MKKFLLIQIIALCSQMLATKGFSQIEQNRKYLGLQFGAGAFAFNANQYNSVAMYSNSHVKSGNTYPQIALTLSAFPVTSKFNVDIGTGGWETIHKIHSDIFPQIYSTDDFSLNQSFGYGDINFGYRVLGTPRTLIVPSIGVGYMGNNIHFQYKSQANAEADRQDEDDDDDEDHNTNIYVAKNNIYYLNFRLNYLIRANKDLWYGLQIGYRYSFDENHILYNPNFPANTNHLLDGFYASLIIAL